MRRVGRALMRARWIAYGGMVLIIGGASLSPLTKGWSAFQWLVFIGLVVLAQVTWAMWALLEGMTAIALAKLGSAEEEADESL